MTLLTRRSMFLGLLAAPAVVAVANLMPLRGAPLIIRPVVYLVDPDGRRVSAPVVDGVANFTANQPFEIAGVEIEGGHPLPIHGFRSPIASFPNVSLKAGDSLTITSIAPLETYVPPSPRHVWVAT